MDPGHMRGRALCMWKEACAVYRRRHAHMRRRALCVGGGVP